MIISTQKKITKVIVMKNTINEQALSFNIQQRKEQCLGLLSQLNDFTYTNQPSIQMTQAACIDEIENVLNMLADEKLTTAQRKIYSKLDRSYSSLKAILWELALSAKHLAVVEARKRMHFSLSNEDLIQEGYIGLLEAAKRFDPSKEIRFSTYARWWVRAQMNRAQEKTGRIIRLPGGAIEQTRYIKQMINQLYTEKNEVNLDEVASAIGISKKRVSLLLQQDKTVPIDQCGSDGLTLNDRLSSDDGSPYDNVMVDQALTLLSDQFEDFLDKREQFILVNYFGLNNHPAKTMKSIGEEITLSRERVRQIKGKALMKLRVMF